MLNQEGHRALVEGTLDCFNPDLSLLTPQNERPAAIYCWALYAPGALAAGVPAVIEKVNSPLYAGINLYARAATRIGRDFIESIGFRPGVRLGERFNPDLHVFRRGDEPAANLPAYDTYRRGRSKGAAITVARSVEDLFKVMSIRSAVYMAEQDCPYEEEFDGNDLSATHLIGYLGDEPAATLRLRFFADFVKVERLAVRHEFRHTRLAFQIVRAGIELARVKGYRRAYGHARKEIAGFWARFGFRTFEGGHDLVFSDHDYVEMVLEMNRHPEAITVGADPYVIIRPEGRWHLPGVLERSAARPTHKVTAA
jgi:predicted GNAT family N-acyltransferase